MAYFAHSALRHLAPDPVAYRQDPSFDSVHPHAAPDFSTDEVIIHAGSLLKESDQALGRLISAYAAVHQIPLLPATHVEAHQCGGWIGRVNGKICVLGNGQLMERVHIDVGALQETRLILEEQGKDIYFLSVGDHLAGLLAVS